MLFEKRFLKSDLERKVRVIQFSSQEQYENKYQTNSSNDTRLESPDCRVEFTLDKEDTPSGSTNHPDAFSQL